LVAVDVQAGRRGEMAEATIRIASAIDPSWLAPTDARLEHILESGRVRAVERTYYGEVGWTERPAPIHRVPRRPCLDDADTGRACSGADVQLLRGLHFAGLPSGPADIDALLSSAASGRRSIDEIDLRAALDRSVARELDRRAPETIVVPSGRTARLEYQED